VHAALYDRMFDIEQFGDGCFHLKLRSWSRQPAAFSIPWSIYGSLCAIGGLFPRAPAAPVPATG